jgi:2-phosphoglycerate kinase
LNSKDIKNSGASRNSSTTCLYVAIVLEHGKDSRLRYTQSSVSCYLAQLQELRCLMRELVGRAQRHKVVAVS